MSSSTANSPSKTQAPTSDDVAEQIETLRSDIGSLTKMIAELGKSKGEEAVKNAKSAADGVQDKAADAAEAARLQAQELQDQANHFIKTQPATALGIAAGLGFLIGLLSSRR